jgi:hypothetical protein
VRIELLILQAGNDFVSRLWLHRAIAFEAVVQRLHELCNRVSITLLFNTPPQTKGIS